MKTGKCFLLYTTVSVTCLLVCTVNRQGCRGRISIWVVVPSPHKRHLLSSLFQVLACHVKLKHLHKQGYRKFLTTCCNTLPDIWTCTQVWMVLTCRPMGPGGPGKPLAPSSPFCPNIPCCPLGPGSPSAPWEEKDIHCLFTRYILHFFTTTLLLVLIHSNKYSIYNDPTHYI